MSEQKTYLLAPNFTFKPYTGPIVLGSLIADPFRPHRVLTTIDATILSTRYPRVEHVTEYERSIGRTTGHEVSVALWANFLQAVNSRVSGERASYISTDYSMESLETEYFVGDPGEAEIQARIAEPRVRAVMKAESLGRRQPIYMVNGVKIAKGLTVRKETGRRRGAGIENEVPIPTPAGEVGVGASVIGAVEREDRDESRVGEDIVFAYQLIKIEVKGWRNKRVEVDEFRHKAAYLDLEDEEDEEEDATAENEDIAASAVHVLDLNAIDEENVATVTTLEGGQVSVVSFPDLH